MHREKNQLPCTIFQGQGHKYISIIFNVIAKRVILECWIIIDRYPSFYHQHCFIYFDSISAFDWNDLDNCPSYMYESHWEL